MNIIERKQYLDRLIAKKDNGMVKVITGIRRVGREETERRGWRWILSRMREVGGITFSRP